MEAIREYLHNLFMSLPETPEVLRAKAALLEMMEDKYDELVSEGKSEKEAVGTVISEFGNLEELAEELGIESYVGKGGEEQESGTRTTKEDSYTAGRGTAGNSRNRRKYQEPPKQQYEWTFSEAKDYLKYAWKHALCIALGVALCIWSPYVSSVMDGAAAEKYVPAGVAEACGSSVLFFFVAIAVVLFCTASHLRKPYGNVAKYGISLDEKAGNLVEQKREKDEQRRFWLRVTGIVLCIVSVVPSSVNQFSNLFLREIMDASILMIVGTGVCLIVLSASVGNRYEELAKAVKNGGGEKQAWVNGRGNGRSRMWMPMAVIIIVVCTLLTGVSLLIGWLIPVSGSDSANAEERYEAEGINEIMIDLDFCDLRIERAAVDEIEFSYTGGDERYIPQAEVSGGSLRISEPRNRSWFGSDFHLFGLGRRSYKRSAMVRIPESLCVQQSGNGLRFSVDVDAGNVMMNELLATNLELDVNAGNVMMNGLLVTNLGLDVDAGNVEGENCVFGGKSQIDVNAGNIEFRESTFENLEANVDAGNFSCLHSQIPLARYQMDLDVDLGHVVVNGKENGSSYQAQPQQGTEEGGESGPVADNCRMTVEVDLGNIEVSDK